MKVLLLAVLAIVLEAIRLSWLGRLPVTPDPLLAMLVLLALSRRSAGGATAGLLLGGLRDAIYGGVLGPETAVFTLAGWAVGSLGRSIYREAALTQGVMILLAGLGRGVFLYFVLGNSPAGGLLSYVLRTALPAAAATAVLAPLIIHLFRGFRRVRVRPRKTHAALNER